ncbi:hypothetical protein EK21DRAFT_114450 [Setomelanomma holmii]|uniref:Uncharacterized protein n=1 Tax=Setomelanomma holmii TaxID=210430 RepID=A0A9P4H5C5_9PLEO|nr:hypothetical protein EK21DRAFT_114450 [Setomelanomma holmii]
MKLRSASIAATRAATSGLDCAVSEATSATAAETAESEAVVSASRVTQGNKTVKIKSTARSKGTATRQNIIKANKIFKRKKAVSSKHAAKNKKHGKSKDTTKSKKPAKGKETARTSTPKQDNFFSPQNHSFYAQIPYEPLDRSSRSIRLLKVCERDADGLPSSYQFTEWVALNKVRNTYTAIS